MSYSRLQERVAELEGLLDNERLYTAEHRGYAQVVGEENKLLREQLDAAREALTRLADRENVVPVDPSHSTTYEFALELGARLSIARAALGVVAPQETAKAADS